MSFGEREARTLLITTPIVLILSLAFRFGQYVEGVFCSPDALKLRSRPKAFA